MFIMQCNTKGENIINEKGEFLLFDTETHQELWVPPDQVHLVDAATNEASNLDGEILDRDQYENYDSDAGTENTNPSEPEATKNFSHEDTLLLIDLVKSNEKNFETSMKKVVWQRITKEINDKTKKKYSVINVENKWKSLKRTYKNIKLRTSESGSGRKYWDYFLLIDEILGNRPEIQAKVTASSSSGVTIHNVKSPKNKVTEEPTFEEGDEEAASSGSTPTDERRNFFKKRKNFANVNDRHKDKMVRQDKFLELFERMVDKM